jgi:3-deoxy-D-manno-octulosonic-acid transferase
MRRRGLALARRAQLDAEDAEPMRVEAGEIDPEAIDAVLGDSMGEMAAYYAAADVVIMGGTLLPFGGQNLIEACAVGVPVILGPHTYNFADAAEQAVAAGAALRVADAREAVHAARRLLADPVRRAEMGRRASAFATAHRGATQRTVDALSPWWPAGRAGPRTD